MRYGKAPVECKHFRCLRRSAGSGTHLRAWYFDGSWSRSLASTLHDSLWETISRWLLRREQSWYQHWRIRNIWRSLPCLGTCLWDICGFQFHHLSAWISLQRWFIVDQMKIGLAAAQSDSVKGPFCCLSLIDMSSLLISCYPSFVIFRN